MQSFNIRWCFGCDRIYRLTALLETTPLCAHLSVFTHGEMVVTAICMNYIYLLRHTSVEVCSVWQPLHAVYWHLFMYSIQQIHAVILYWCFILIWSGVTGDMFFAFERSVC